MAAHKKKAARLKAFIVFIDESGLMMSPLLRRSWSPTGKTPVLHQRTRSHKKVSAIAGLCVSPTRDNIRLYFRLHTQTNINSLLITDFLKILLRQLGRPVVLIWDRLLAHRSIATGNFIRKTAKLHAFYLPPYAPELNPVEYSWSYLKYNPLANLPITDVYQLAVTAHHHGRVLQRNPLLLRSFMKHSPLFLRLK